MAENNRFLFQQGETAHIRDASGIQANYSSVLIDRETGVNYLFLRSAGSIAVTPLIGADGKPIVTKNLP